MKIDQHERTIKEGMKKDYHKPYWLSPPFHIESSFMKLGYQENGYSRLHQDKSNEFHLQLWLLNELQEEQNNLLWRTHGYLSSTEAEVLAAQDVGDGEHYRPLEDNRKSPRRKTTTNSTWREDNYGLISDDDS